MNRKVCFMRMLCLMLVLCIMSGCAHIPGGIAASNTPLEGRKYTILGKTEATDSRICLFGFLPVTGANSVRAALDKASISAGGDALIDITVESYYHYWILFSKSITKVEGVAIRFNK
jgi:hypothetical protein